MTALTYTLAEVAEKIGNGCTERWVTKHVRTGRFPARKVCGHWVMTDQDIRDTLDACLRPATPRIGLTDASRRRRPHAS